MNTTDWLIAAACLAVILFAYWVGTGRLPGERAWHIYRYARTQRRLGRRAALAWAWRIWRPSL